MITIVNLRTTRNCTRVDRSTVLGNPYHMGQDQSETKRNLVCDLYAAYCWDAYNRDAAYRAAIDELVKQYVCGMPLVLGCWCAPKRCHAESIRDLVITLANAYANDNYGA